MTTSGLDRHIIATPGMLGGKAHIAGRRISVQDIAIWHDRLGKTVDEICADFDLSLAEVYAALAYYFDHRDDIDRHIQGNGRICKGATHQHAIDPRTTPDGAGGVE